MAMGMNLTGVIINGKKHGIAVCGVVLIGMKNKGEDYE